MSSATGEEITSLRFQGGWWGGEGGRSEPRVFLFACL